MYVKLNSSQYDGQTDRERVKYYVASFLYEAKGLKWIHVNLAMKLNISIYKDTVP